MRILDSDTQLVIDIVNKARKFFNLTTIDDMPVGIKGQPFACPINKALEGLPVSGAFTRIDYAFEEGAINAEDERILCAWIGEFDKGMYHQYDDNWCPSDDDVYRNNPHVHADAMHPLNLPLQWDD